MATNWTDEQKAVIAHRDGNLLVAAAAGSGKTAVLSERIVEMLKDEKHPLDVDRFLVVTFTRAAAAEMRERIAKKISEYVEANPENEHMRRQGTLVNNATISTIDSFCNQIVKEYFHVIDLDPSFRMSDDNEEGQLHADVLAAIIEKHYNDKDEDFIGFSKRYATSGKRDKNLEVMIEALYRAAQSNPYPEKWLEDCKTLAAPGDLAELDRTEFAKAVTLQMVEHARLCIKKLDKLMSLPEFDPSTKIATILEADKEIYKTMTKAGNYTQMCVAVRAFEGKPRWNVPKEERENAEPFKTDRKNINDETQDKLIKKYFSQNPQKTLDIIKYVAKDIEVLIDLTLEFSRELLKTKKEEGIFSFNDIEHMALYILRGEDPEKDELTVAATNLRDRYDAIIIDEYQDSNMMQESILTAISGESRKTADKPEGEPNIFMVGDVKQSIYRFRQARPELFIEKYDNYKEEGTYKKIVLGKNFRSRQQVLDATNVIFECVMHKEFGNIEYDKDAALYLGNKDYTDVDNDLFNPELILVRLDKQEDAENDKSFQEAYSTAEYIKQLMAPDSDFRVMHDKVYEKPRYSDIAILLRSKSQYLENFTAVLMDEGIPVSANVSNGFFETGEVKTIFNYLRILMNFKQDIPCAAVLYSPMVCISNEEVGDISKRDRSLFENVEAFVADGTNEDKNPELFKKLKHFLETYEVLKHRSRILPVSELVEEIYRITDFYKTVLALPQGRRRAANLDFFKEKAFEFEKLGYSGLFEFVRYLEKMQDQEIDFGEASAESNDDAVRIMTIHGSKGLEFPVVIIPQMLKKFNNRDSKERVVIHPAFGPAMDLVNYEKRTKTANLIRKWYIDDIKYADIAEELRLFYVALTRAREKIVMIGSSANVSKIIKGEESDIFTPSMLGKANNYFDFLKYPLFSDSQATEKLLEAATVIDSVYETETKRGTFHTFEPYQEVISLKSESTGNRIDFQVSIVPGHGRPINITEKKEGRFDAERIAQKALFDPDVPDILIEKADRLKQCANFVYPFEGLKDRPVKYSVSQLKKAQYTEDRTGFDDDYDNAVRSVAEEEEFEAKKTAKPAGKCAKSVKNTKTAGKGAKRGTAIHAIMEHLPFEDVMSTEAVENLIKTLVDTKIIGAEEAELADVKGIADFTKTLLYERMCRANAQNRLYREQPFTFGRPAKGFAEDELELIQGVIDAYFVEDGDIVLMDYKTDRADEEELKARYKIQLDIYAEALEKATGAKIKEKVIYSFHNTKIIEL